MSKLFAKNMILRIVVWLMTVLWMSGIFFLSSRPVDISRADSAWLMEKLGLVDSIEEAEDTTNAQAMSLQTFIRKKAHIFLFSALSMLIFASIYGYFGKVERTAIISWILTTIYGATDEIHQIFSKRGAMVSDVIVDSRGAVWGLMFMIVVFMIIENCSPLYQFIDKLYKLNPNENSKIN